MALSKRWPDDQLTRFHKSYRRLSEHECWPWLKGKRGKGYGEFHVKGGRTNRTLVRMIAHRFMWQLTHGAIPEGKWVLHRCNNPKCVNPLHLYLGTNSDNQIDRAKTHAPNHGFLKGSKSHLAKLTEDQVRAILQMWEVGFSSGQIAREFGVHYSNVWLIVKGKTWKHITQG